MVFLIEVGKEVNMEVRLFFFVGGSEWGLVKDLLEVNLRGRKFIG